jgi:hypothetical protein
MDRRLIVERVQKQVLVISYDENEVWLGTIAHASNHWRRGAVGRRYVEENREEKIERRKEKIEGRNELLRSRRGAQRE